MKHILMVMTALALFSCKKEVTLSITNQTDYNVFLSSETNKTYLEAASEKEFWSNRLKADSSGVGDLGPLAGAYTRMFESSGKVENLKLAEQLYRKAIEISAHNKDGYTRSLAHNLISQHRFKEARELLEASYKGVSNKHATELQLFDAYMEVGEYDLAYEFLNKVKNNKDFNYLIRLSKWSDYKGDLDAAIQFMEQAKEVVESRNSKPLKIWTYTNLADYYGHAGRIEESYQHYVKTLELQPDNAYAKKGIAWISYAAEGNTWEANRILDSVMVHHTIPDYYLLKAEMAEYDGESALAEKHKEVFVTAIANPAYGDMYNTYLIELYADSSPERALALAKSEVANRATPETYHYLAYAQLKSGDKKAALKTIENHVEGKTTEPMAQYHSALVYKANGVRKAVKRLKKELEGASFEMGPVMAKEINRL